MSRHFPGLSGAWGACDERLSTGGPGAVKREVGPPSPWPARMCNPAAAALSSPSAAGVPVLWRPRVGGTRGFWLQEKLDLGVHSLNMWIFLGWFLFPFKSVMMGKKSQRSSDGTPPFPAMMSCSETWAVLGCAEETGHGKPGLSQVHPTTLKGCVLLLFKRNEM